MVEAAAQHGLQYVADASFDDGNEYRHSRQARSLLAPIPEDEFVVREQYLDFIEGRASAEACSAVMRSTCNGLSLRNG